jgi:hypothetical protein
MKKNRVIQSTDLSYLNLCRFNYLTNSNPDCVTENIIIIFFRPFEEAAREQMFRCHSFIFTTPTGGGHALKFGGKKITLFDIRYTIFLTVSEKPIINLDQLITE